MKTSMCTGYSTVFHYIDITEEPQSVTAKIGTDAQFYCAGTEVIIFWIVDGLPLDNPNISGRGIVAENDSVSGFNVKSKLTVPVTLENDNTSVQCAANLSFSSKPLFSAPATLSVISGIC